MKLLFVLSLTIGLHLDTFSQNSPKPPDKSAVGLNALNNWPDILRPAISNDGKYASYIIRDTGLNNSTLVIRSIGTTWKRQMPCMPAPFSFTADSKKIILKTKDGISIVSLGDTAIINIQNVLSFNFPNGGDGNWLLYRTSNPSNKFVLRNLSTDKEIIIDSVRNYLFSNDGKALVLQSSEKVNGLETDVLKWVSFPSLTVTTIYRGNKTGDFLFDETGTQLGFIVKSEIANQISNSLWYYELKSGKAVQIADDKSIGPDSTLKIDNIKRFSEDNLGIFFSLKKEEPQKIKKEMVKVDVWSYTDPHLQSEQLNNPENRTYDAIIRLPDQHINRIEYENEYILKKETKEGHLLLMKTGKGDIHFEWNWNKTAQTSVFLVSTKDGTRICLKDMLAERTPYTYYISPGGKYIVYYDPERRNYFSYAVSSGITKNITHSIPVIWTSLSRNDEPDSSYLPIGLTGWMQNDAGVLIYAQYDIFLLDPSGEKPPVNLTNGYGLRHHIVFQLALPQFGETPVFNPDEKVILSAFDMTNKNNGFYHIFMNKIGNPIMLTMQPCLYEAPRDVNNLYPTPPKKARDTDCYLVMRKSAIEFPNYYVTNDFKSFTPISNLHPEKAYNWLTTSLITWRTLNGQRSQGILYKPENFDATKKYPIIFYYYETQSESLNDFIKPELSDGVLNIPFFVSNGYLVFVPDIHYKIGHTGESAYNSIVSAANYLSKLPYVNSKQMGLQGHSFGGWETNYLITHTNLFSAACSASGMSDFISSYGSIRNFDDGTSRQGYYEFVRERMGGTLWQKPNLYLLNSPVLRADKVTTPLLLMNNKLDGQVPFQQGIEFFTALRRLGKKVWMLQYDDEGHVLTNDVAQRDFTIRMKQFYDHYLKGSPAPLWMTRGIPASSKGIDSGLELDHEVKTPGAGLLIEKKS